jgi:hypothetical protein
MTVILKFILHLLPECVHATSEMAKMKFGGLYCTLCLDGCRLHDMGEWCFRAREENGVEEEDVVVSGTYIRFQLVSE